jgi:predicted nuclease with TOPRIM domain
VEPKTYSEYRALYKALKKDYDDLRKYVEACEKCLIEERKDNKDLMQELKKLKGGK